MADDIQTGQANSNDALSESLSALLDSEHSELDLRRVLKAAQSDTFVADKWHRLHLARNIIQRQPASVVDPSFLEGVRAVIEEESVPVVHVESRFALSRYTGKIAIAACTTLAVLLGSQYLQPDDDASTADAHVVTSTGGQAVVPNGFELPPLQARTVSGVTNINRNTAPAALPINTYRRAQPQADVVLSPELKEQLNRMLLKHTEKASANGGLGVMPFTRIEPSESAGR